MRFHGEDILEGNLMAMVPNHLISMIFGFGTQILRISLRKFGRYVVKNGS